MSREQSKGKEYTTEIVETEKLQTGSTQTVLWSQKSLSL